MAPRAPTTQAPAPSQAARAGTPPPPPRPPRPPSGVKRAALVATAAGAALAATGCAFLPGALRAAPAAAVPKPPIVSRLIPFPAHRKQEMAAYAKRHYGIDSWRLTNPHVI